MAQPSSRRLITEDRWVAKNTENETKYGGLPTAVETLEERTTTQSLGTSSLDSILTVGVYGQNVTGNATTERRYPVASRGHLVVSSVATTTTVVQTYIASSRREVYVREYYANAWSEWRLQTPGITKALSTENLDNLRTGAIFGQTLTDNATPERGYPRKIRGLLTVVQISGDANVVQYYQTGGSSLELYAREYYASTWSAWVKLSGASNGGAPLAAATKRVGTALSLSGGTETLTATADYGARLLLDYAVKIPRWRIHLRNHNLRDDITYPGALNLTGFSIGEAEYSQGKPSGRWVGAVTMLQGAAATPASGAEWVSDWFDYTLEPHKQYMLSYGFTAPEGQQVHRGMGAVWTVAGGSSATHTNSYGARSTLPALDIWLECEVPQTTRVLAVIGDSYSVGHSATSPVHDSWLAVHCRRVGALPMFWAASGDRMEWFASKTTPKATRYDDVARPDLIFFALGSNDASALGAADTPTDTAIETMQSRFMATMSVVRDKVTGNVAALSLRPPFGPDDKEAEMRIRYNEWLEMTLPAGISIYHDTATPVSKDGYFDDRWRASPANVHLSTAGYARMASAL